MSKKIQVENLPASITEDKILKLFKPFGVVLQVKLEPANAEETPRSAIVDMADNQAAHEAIEKLNETKHGGNILLVHKAHGKEHLVKKSSNPKSSHSFGGSGGHTPFRIGRSSSNRGR